MMTRKPYPSDVSDDGPFVVAPYLTLLPEPAMASKRTSRPVSRWSRVCFGFTLWSTMPILPSSVRTPVAWISVMPLAHARLWDLLKGGGQYALVAATGEHFTLTD